MVPATTEISTYSHTLSLHAALPILLLVADLVDELLAGHAIDDAADCDDIAARRIDQAGSVEEARKVGRFIFQILVPFLRAVDRGGAAVRSEEHTSELQYLMRNSYAVFCL